MPLTA